MFGWILAGATVTIFAAIAAIESLTPISKKVKAGDAVFVPPGSIKLLSAGNPADIANLASFLNGFTAQSIKIGNVGLTKGDSVNGTGDIVGFPSKVSFPLGSVTKIERNGLVIA